MRVPPLQYPAPVQVMPPLTLSACSNTAPSYTSSLINSYTLIPALCSTHAAFVVATFHPFHAGKSFLLSFPKHMWQCSHVMENVMYFPLFALCLHGFMSPSSEGDFFHVTVSLYLCWTLLRSERHINYSLSCWIVPAQIWSILHLNPSYLTYSEIIIICWLAKFLLCTTDSVIL